MKYMTMAATVMALLFLLTTGAPIASADVLFCVGGTTNTCSATAPLSGAYWEVDPTITLNTGASTFAFTLTITAKNGAGGFLQDFSAQYFFGPGQSVSNLAWIANENPGNWIDLAASKAGNTGTCNGSANGVFCASSDQNTNPPSALPGVDLSSTQVFGVTGSYTGTFLDPNGNYHLQLAATQNSTGGGNVLAISQDIAVPDGGVTLMLLGGALVSLETLRRRFRA